MQIYGEFALMLPVLGAYQYIGQFRNGAVNDLLILSLINMRVVSGIS